MNFRGNAKFVKMCIDTYLPKKIAEETQGGAMPYIKLSTLLSLQIPYITFAEQCNIVNQYDAIACKLENEICLLGLLQCQKTFLLNALFI